MYKDVGVSDESKVLTMPSLVYFLSGERGRATTSTPAIVLFRHHHQSIHDARHCILKEHSYIWLYLCSSLSDLQEAAHITHTSQQSDTSNPPTPSITPPAPILPSHSNPGTYSSNVPAMVTTPTHAATINGLLSTDPPNVWPAAFLLVVAAGVSAAASGFPVGVVVP